MSGDYRLDLGGMKVEVWFSFPPGLSSLLVMLIGLIGGLQ
jgi:hypothetical protein